MHLTDCKDSPKSIADRIEATEHALRVKELAELLSWSPTLVYNRARSGRMGHAVIRVGGTVRFDPFWTAKWLRDQMDLP
jgi:hypothetical protein